jgi:hypothetical protein
MTRDLCDTCATELVERIAARSTDWTRDSALLSYIEIDAFTVGASRCDACGDDDASTYRMPEAIATRAGRPVSRFAPSDAARLAAIR